MRRVDKLAQIGAPLPWAIDTGTVVAANGQRVWGFDDANDDRDVVTLVVATMNDLAETDELEP